MNAEAALRKELLGAYEEEDIQSPDRSVGRKSKSRVSNVSSDDLATKRCVCMCVCVFIF